MEKIGQLGDKVPRKGGGRGPIPNFEQIKYTQNDHQLLSSLNGVLTKREAVGTESKLEPLVITHTCALHVVIR